MSDTYQSSFCFDELSEEGFLEVCRSMSGKEKKVFLFLGGVRSGKTTRFLEIIKKVKDLNLSVGGICQPEKQGTYFAQDIKTKAKKWIAERRGDSVFFNPETFDWSAEKIIQARRCCDVLAVDEIGRLESYGKGHISAIVQPIKDEKTFLYLLCVRKDAFNRICRYLPEISGVIHL